MSRNYPGEVDSHCALSLFKPMLVLTRRIGHCRFTGATLAINSQMAAFVEGKPGLHFLDCADALLRPVSREPEQIMGGLMSGGNFATDAVDGLASKADRSLRLRRDFMATAQHPNVDGMKALAHCLAPKIDELFAKKQQPLAKMSP